jgi:RNA-splicing ligase RtcB
VSSLIVLVVEKVHALTRRPYVRTVFALPDLTVADPCPVGTSVEVFRHIYPTWIGDDIGCGVALFKLAGEVRL